jgi:hypothetical protein
VTADLGARDTFREHLIEAVNEFKQAGATPEQINVLLAAAQVPNQEEALISGLPQSLVGAVTLDGRRWLEVMGEIHRDVQPGGGVILTFKVAQAPGGKAARDGVKPGDVVSVSAGRVVAVMRKGT